jgi:uncharacterized lipoprotein YddW (UPF0748 family)
MYWILVYSFVKENIQYLPPLSSKFNKFYLYKMKIISIFIVCIIFVLYFNLHADSQPKYEFRAAWIATIGNTDWPSQKEGISSDLQKTEFISILDALQHDGINAVIVQIRPAADAFYESKYEPWSEYLSGKQGIAPNPYYDPLQFMIEETHKRGMEFHAWINPYRAVINVFTSSIGKNTISKTHPEWFVTYDKTKYFNPGLPDVMRYLEGIVRDIITRYDIDGLHMDDYFYPYRIPGKEFADNAAYLKYGNGLNKEDWRRSNCDSIIKYIHEIILAAKPKIKFGISPFGVWRNKSVDSTGSDTRAGQTNYDDLYADILLWLRKGWIDYVAPQIYWEIGNNLCDYQTLLQWWSDHSYGKQVYIGHAVAKAGTNDAWRNPHELPDEISLLRENKNVQGSIFFSAHDLLKNPNGWEDSLQNNYYKIPALIPPMSWIDSIAPQNPEITRIKSEQNNNDNLLKIEGKASNENETETIRNYVVYFSENLATLGNIPEIVFAADKDKHFFISINESQIPAEWGHCFMAISCVDRENNESKLSNVIELNHIGNFWVKEK